MAAVRTKRSKISMAVIYFVLLCFLVFTMLPLVYLVVTAFKPMDELFIWPPKFYVKRPTLSNFESLLTAMNGFTVPFTRYVFNSLFTTLASVLGTMVVCGMGAYGLSKFRFLGSSLIFSVVIATLMFSPQVTQIPTYMIVSGLHLTDTYWALILPKLPTALYLFLTKQFIDQIPNAYIESARMDGAGEWRCFARIVLPMCRPALLTIVVFSFTAYWNDFFSPMVYTSSEAMKTLPLAIQTIGSGVMRVGASGAAALLMTVPTILVFLFMQKRVMETMIHSGIKG